MQPSLRLFAVLSLLLPVVVNSQPLISHPDQSVVLSQKWQWGEQQLSDSDEPVAWLVYQFDTELDEKLGILFSSQYQNYFGRFENYRSGGNWRNSNSVWRSGFSLAALQAGNSRAQQAFTKPISLLFLARFEAAELVAVQFVEKSATVDWDGGTVRWLGLASANDSFQFIDQLLQDNLSEEIRQGLIFAAGLHAVPRRDNFLQALYASDQRQSYDRVIVASMALRQTSASEELLLTVAENENENLTNRRTAISALRRFDSNEAVSSLQQLSGPLNPQSVRTEAIASLALFESDAVTKFLQDLLASDGDEEVLMEALDAIAERPNQFDTLAGIVRGHVSSRLRGEAVEAMDKVSAQLAVPFLFGLAEDQDLDHRLRQEALETLAEFAPQLVASGLNQIAWSDNNERLRDQAVESLADLDNGDANRLLLEIARNHPSQSTRDEALDQLEDSIL